MFTRIGHGTGRRARVPSHSLVMALVPRALFVGSCNSEAILLVRRLSDAVVSGEMIVPGSCASPDGMALRGRQARPRAGLAAEIVAVERLVHSREPQSGQRRSACAGRCWRAGSEFGCLGDADGARRHGSTCRTRTKTVPAFQMQTRARAARRRIVRTFPPPRPPRFSSSVRSRTRRGRFDGPLEVPSASPMSHAARHQVPDVPPKIARRTRVTLPSARKVNGRPQLA